ncbi:MAG: tetratricopeptide repeat protein [Bradymonadaceae bacterium]
MDPTSRRWWLVAVFVVLAGCASPQTRADRKFDAGKYQQAFTEYKQLIEEGTDDWKVYFRAAKAAKQIGNFAVAEKYYSQALRNGGGADVAREFANFYLKTSNYTKAVRLLQFLLEVEGNKQPIYNNIGTAMMYAGAPLDAETYLLIAQQMKPDDPVPYVNLGVLYERHLRKPQMAVAFYRCYLELTDKRGTQHERIQSRVSELAPAGRGAPSGNRVTCGTPYYPGGGGGTDKPDIDKKMEELGADAPKSATGNKKGKPIDLGLGATPKKKSAGDGPTASFEGMDQSEEGGGSTGQGKAAGKRTPDAGSDAGVRGTATADAGTDSGSADAATGGDEEGTGADAGGPTIERAAKSSPDHSPWSNDAGSGPDAVLKRARAAFEQENYQTVVDAISGLSLRELNLEAMRIYGLSLAELGDDNKARQWLEWVVDRNPDPEVVATLIAVYDRLERKGARERICRKFRKREAYQKATKPCPSSVEAPDKEILEKYRRQQKRNDQ